MSNRAKGNKTEREAEQIYERAGYDPDLIDRVGSTAGGRRMTDAFGHVDIIVLGDDHIRFVQSKTNAGGGVRKFVEWAGPLPLYIKADFLIRHDGHGGHDPTPPRWRLQKPHTSEDGWTYQTVVDERKDGVPADGEGIVGWLQEAESDD